MRALFALKVLLLIAAVTACTRTEPPVLGEPSPLPVPSGLNASGPRLSTGADGTVVLSWMQKSKDGATLRFSSLRSHEWQDAVDVIADPDMFVNWADLPSVTSLGNDRWLAHWLSKSAEMTYAYDVLLARSNDDGQSWSEPMRPHTDGTPTEHGFVSLISDGDAATLLWLDGRKTVEDSVDPQRSSMTLRSARVTANGEISDAQLVDDIVCDCCQTDVAVSSVGPLAVYRNRTVDEIRDIYVTRYVDGQWEPGAPIAHDGWKISACPVNGPAIDAGEQLVAVAWFSAANDRPVVRAALSTNGGKSFRKPVEIASRNASGHVGIAIVDRRSVAVSWVESDRRGTHAIKVRSLTTDGSMGPAETMGRSDLYRIYPQLMRRDDHLFLAWTDKISDATEIVSIKVPILGFYDR